MGIARRMRTMPIAAAAAFTLALAGCDSITGTSEQAFSADEVIDIATFLADVEDIAGVDDVFALHTGSHTFIRSAPCPLGGSVTVAGSGESTYDPETRIGTRSWQTTLSHDECAFEVRRRGQKVTAVIDGSVTATGESSFQFEGHGLRRTILSHTRTRLGSMTTTIGDDTRTCEIDVTETYDPETGAFTVSGVVCGREIEVTRTIKQRGRHEDDD